MARGEARVRAVRPARRLLEGPPPKSGRCRQEHQRHQLRDRERRSQGGRLIDADGLQQEPGNRVEGEHQRKHLAVPPGQRGGRGEAGQHRQDRRIDRGVELRRMHRQAPRAAAVGRRGWQEPPRGLVEPRRALRWKPYRPGQITGPPVTAAIEETADPANGQTDEQPRGNAISQSRERQTPAAGKPPGSQCCRRQRPKHHQTSGRDIEYGRKRLRPTPSGGEKLIVVFDHIEESRADDAP